MQAYKYEVTRDIAEIGALVWDVLVWRYPEIFLVRKQDGQISYLKYDAHWWYIFLKYQSHLRPFSADCPSAVDLARQVVGSSRLPPIRSAAPYLRVVE